MRRLKRDATIYRVSMFDAGSMMHELAQKCAPPQQVPVSRDAWQIQSPIHRQSSSGDLRSCTRCSANNKNQLVFSQLTMITTIYRSIRDDRVQVALSQCVAITW